MTKGKGDKLREILRAKSEEITSLREDKVRFEKSYFFDRNVISLRSILSRSDKPLLIAEAKKCSPSFGSFDSSQEIRDICSSYVSAGADALSILTEKQFFGGSPDDIFSNRESLSVPILRKDFIFEEIQVLETKAIGADVILLIASVARDSNLRRLVTLSKSIGLEVLLEVHSREEFEEVESDGILQYVDIIGVNNRNLDDLTVSLGASQSLISLLPKDIIKVSESGILTIESALSLIKLGFDGLLVGQMFLSSKDPGRVCGELVESMSKIKRETEP